jgi:hypothetical protein
MSIIISDSDKAPEGYLTAPYNDQYVHYDPNQSEDIETMLANANAGDDSELLDNAYFETKWDRDKRQGMNFIQPAIERASNVLKDLKIEVVSP